MKVLIITLLGGLLTFGASAQDTTFQTTINAVVNGNDQGFEILHASGGYLILSGTHCNNTNTACMALAKVNDLGEKIWSKVYNEYPTPSIAYGMTRGYNDDYFAAGIKVLDSTNKYYLIRFNSEGDSLWTKVYDIPQSAFNTIKMRPDGILMAYGQEQAVAHVYKLDSLGNVLNKIFWTDNEITISSKIDFLGTKTVALSRSKQSGNPMRYGNVLVYDAQDSLLWDKRTFNSIDGNCRPTLATLSNHTIVTAYCKDTLITPDSYPSAQGIMAIDSIGNTKWQYFFDAPYWKRLSNLYALDDGNILGVGFTYENTDFQGWMIKMSAAGELLWEHRYISLEHPSDGWLLSAIETPEGGIIAAGAIGDTTGIGNSLDYNIWFIKTDENGCVGNPNNCLEEDIFLHIEEENSISQWVSGYPIRIAPNPTQGQFTLQYQLPPDLQNVHFQLYTLTGQLIYEIPLGTGQDLSLPQETQVVLPSHVTSGMYFYQAQSEVGRLGSGKLVVR